MELPTLFCIYATAYGVAVEKLERQFGRNLYGKYYLEKEVRNGCAYFRNR